MEFFRSPVLAMPGSKTLIFIMTLVFSCVFIATVDSMHIIYVFSAIMKIITYCVHYQGSYCSTLLLRLVILEMYYHRNFKIAFLFMSYFFYQSIDGNRVIDGECLTNMTVMLAVPLVAEFFTILIYVIVSTIATLL